MGISCKPCGLRLKTSDDYNWHIQYSDLHKVKAQVPAYGEESVQLEIKASELLQDSDKLSRGLFAGERIVKGQVVGWYHGELKSGVQSPVQTIYAFIAPAWKDDKIQTVGGWIDAVKGDESKDLTCLLAYANHSIKKANLVVEYRKCAEAPLGAGIALVALKNIEAGQELLYDYGTWYHNWLRSNGILVE